MQRIRTRHLKRPGGDREFVELLLMAQQHDLETVNTACELALSQGTGHLSTIVNIVHRLTEQQPPAALNVVNYPRIKAQPEANCQRYDGLIRRWLMQNLVEDLRSLKLYGMAQTLPEVLAKSRTGATLDILLTQLIRAEQSDRQVRSLQYQMKVAKFPHPRDLAGFNFDESPIQVEQLQTLAAGEFAGSARNLILIGGTGTGKPI